MHRGQTLRTEFEMYSTAKGFHLASLSSLVEGAGLVRRSWSLMQCGHLTTVSAGSKWQKMSPEATLWLSAAALAICVHYVAKSRRERRLAESQRASNAPLCRTTSAPCLPGSACASLVLHTGLKYGRAVSMFNSDT